MILSVWYSKLSSSGLFYFSFQSTSRLCYVQCECYFLFFGDGCTGEMAADLKLVIKRWEVNKKQSFSTWCTVKIVTSSLVKKINRRKIIAYIFTCHNNRFFLSNKHSDLLLTMGLFYFLWNVPAFLIALFLPRFNGHVVACLIFSTRSV